MASLGAAYVEISANLAKLDQGLKLAKSNTNKFLKGVSKDMESLNFMPIIKNIAMIGWQFAQITAPITVVTGALFALQKHAANIGEELLKMNERTGISIEELYSLKKVLELDNLSLGDLSISLKFLSQKLVEARTEAGQARDIFKALDIDTSKPLIETFLTLGKRFADFKDGEGKVNLATLLLSRNGQNLIPVLNKLGNEGLKISDTFSKESAVAADEFNDSLTELKQVAEELGITLANKMIPSTTSFLKNMQSVRGFFLQFFPEFLTPLEYLKDIGDEAWNKYVRGIEKAVSATNEFREASRGVTSIKDMPFVFEGEAFKPKTEVPIIIDSKQLKKDEDEAKRTAHAIAEAYKDMYDSLKFDTGKYYEYRKSLLEKQRDEEIKTTGDLQLAWEAYHARLAELDEQRLERSNKIMDGVELFFRQEQRSGITVANSVKEAMESVKNSSINNIADLMKGIETGSIKAKNAFKEMAKSILGSFLDMANQMIAKWIIMKIIGVVAGAWGQGASVSMGTGGTAGTTQGGGFGTPGYVGDMSMKGVRGNTGGGVTVNQNISIPISAMDSQDVDRALRRGGHGAITDIMAQSVERSVGYARRIRGQKVG